MSLSVAFDPQQFDADKRTIGGLVVPYGEETRAEDSRRIKFAPGAFTRSIEQRADKVKLYAMHTNGTRWPIGRSVSLTEDSAGVHAEFAIARTAAADEALELIRSGTVEGFSIELQPIRDRREGPVTVVTEGGIRNVALVDESAFESARVTSFGAQPAADHTNTLSTEVARKRLGLTKFGAALMTNPTHTDRPAITTEQRPDAPAMPATFEAYVAERDRLSAEARGILDRAGQTLDGEGKLRFEAIEQRLGELADLQKVRTPVAEQPQVFSSALPFGVHAPEHLRQLEAAIRSGSPIRVTESPETVRGNQFATVGTGQLGDGRTHVAQLPSSASRNLWTFTGNAATPLDAASVSIASLNLPAPAGLAAEGASGQELDAFAEADSVFGRAHAYSTVSAASLLSTPIEFVMTGHTLLMDKQVDAALVGMIEDVASATVTDYAEAILTVAEAANVDPSQVIAFGNAKTIASVAGPSAMTPANGSDVASHATAIHGARLYPTARATVDLLTVFAAPALRGMLSPLSSGVVLDPKTGETVLGSFYHFGAGLALGGSALTINPA